MEDFYASDVSISAGFFGTLVDHTGIFAEAEAFAAAAQGPIARCSRSTARAARTGSCCARWPSSAPTRSCSWRATSTTRSSTRSRPRLDFRFIPTPYEPRFEAVLPRAPPTSSTRSRATRRRWRSSTRARPTRASPPTRGRSPARSMRSDHAMVIVDEAWGGHLRFHPDLPESAMGAGRHLRAVDPQARRRLAADRAHPLEDRARGLRADGGGLPRVRHHLAQLPPARQRRCRRLARWPRAARTSSVARSSARWSSSRRSTPASPTSIGWTTPRGSRATGTASADGPGQDDRGLSRYDLSGYDGGAGARRARDRDREGGPAHDHAHHDLPARPRRGPRRSTPCTTSSSGTARRATRASRCRPIRSARSTTGR